MDTNVVLILTAFDWIGGNYYVASQLKDRWSLPTKPLKAEQQPDNIARELFGESVRLHPNWATIEITDAIVINGNLNLVYCSQSPFDSQWKIILLDTHIIKDNHPFYRSLASSLSRRNRE